MSFLRRFSSLWVLLVLVVLMVTPPLIAAGQTLKQADALTDQSPLEAAQLYERTARLLPWRSDLWEQAGMAAFDGGNYEEAIRLLGVAKKKNSLTVNGWDKLALSYWYLDQRQAALQIWQQTLETNGPNGMLYLRLAMAAYTEGDLQTEQTALEDALVYVDNASAHYRLGLLLTVSEPERSLEHFRAAEQLDPVYASAVNTLRAALNLSSLQASNSQAAVIRGNALGMVNQWNLALLAFEQAVSADANNAEAWAWLGLAKQATGQDGVQEIERALKLEPQSANIHAQRGLYFQRVGDWGKAEVAFLEAARLDPSDPAWQASLGQVTAELGNIPLALEYYKAATDLDPDQAQYWYLLAAFCAQNQVYLETDGLPAAVKARDLASDDPAMQDVVGWVFLGMGNLDMAQEYFQRALELDADFSLARLHSGLTYLQQGDSDQAYAALQQAARDTGEIGAEARRILSQVFP